MTIINGESFGKYKILSEIGNGGTVEVFLAGKKEHFLSQLVDYHMSDSTVNHDL